MFLRTKVCLKLMIWNKTHFFKLDISWLFNNTETLLAWPYIIYVQMQQLFQWLQNEPDQVEKTFHSLSPFETIKSFHHKLQLLLTTQLFSYGRRPNTVWHFQLFETSLKTLNTWRSYPLNEIRPKKGLRLCLEYLSQLDSFECYCISQHVNQQAQRSTSKLIN